MRPPISVVITTKDEAAVIGALIGALLQGSLVPGEIIIVDSNSTDGTADVVNSYAANFSAVRLISQACNRSQGRNLGSKAASHDIIVCIDAGVTPEPGCMEALVRYFTGNPTIAFASGAVRAKYSGTLEQAFGLLVPPDPSERALEERRWLPTSRLFAYRKEAFMRSGGYPEHNFHSEDYEYAESLYRAGERFGFASEALAVWCPRPSWSSFYRQYHAYAYGEGRRGKVSFPRIFKTLIYLLWAGLMLLAIIFPLVLLLALLGVGGYVALAAARGFKNSRSCSVALASPAVEVVNDLADITGYAHGILHRLFGSPPAKVR